MVIPQIHNSRIIWHAQFGRNTLLKVAAIQIYTVQKGYVSQAGRIVLVKLLTCKAMNCNLLGRTHSSEWMLPVRLLMAIEKNCKLLQPPKVSSIVRNQRLPRTGEIIPCNPMLETLRETTLWLRRLHITSVHPQNETFGFQVVGNDWDGSYVIADINPIRASWSEVLPKWGCRPSGNWTVENTKEEWNKTRKEALP